MSREYYEKLWWDYANKPIKRWIASRGIDIQVRKTVILSAVKELRQNRSTPLGILDLGCGLGWLTDCLSKFGNVVGVDWAVSPAQKLFPDLQFIEADIASEDIPGKYDLVVSSELYEHLDSEGQTTFLKKVSNLLHEDGFLILTTPNRPIHEVFVKDFKDLVDEMQPTENWVDSATLSESLEPYFIILSLESVFPYHLLKRVRGKWILNKLVTVMMLLYIPVYRIFIAAPKENGLILVLVARKRSATD